MTKREFLAAGVGAGLGLTKAVNAFAQQGSSVARPESAPSAGNRPIPNRIAKTTKLFKSPPGFPNGIAAVPEGLWIAEQKMSGAQAVQYHVAEPKTLTEECWLVDWNGKLLKTVTTQSRNTSGLAVGGGFIWMCANAPPEGIFQVDMNSRLVSHRQIPLGPATTAAAATGRSGMMASSGSPHCGCAGFYAWIRFHGPRNFSFRSMPLPEDPAITASPGTTARSG
jgi:hypothetical protein